MHEIVFIQPAAQVLWCALQVQTVSGNLDSLRYWGQCQIAQINDGLPVGLFAFQDKFD